MVLYGVYSKRILRELSENLEISLDILEINTVDLGNMQIAPSYSPIDMKVV